MEAGFMAKNVSLIDVPQLSERVVEGVALTVICVLAVGGNVLLWVVVARCPELHCTSNTLLLCLSGADLVVAIFNMPLTVYTIFLGRWEFTDGVCVTTAFTNMFSFVASVMSMCMITFNRYIRVCRPSLYPALYSHRTAALHIAGVCALSVILSTPPLLGWGQYGYLESQYFCYCLWSASASYSIFMVAFCFGGTTSLLTSCYIAIYRTFTASKRLVARSSEMVNIPAERGSFRVPSSSLSSLKQAPRGRVTSLADHDLCIDGPREARDGGYSQTRERIASVGGLNSFYLDRFREGGDSEIRRIASFGGRDLHTDRLQEDRDTQRREKMASAGGRDLQKHLDDGKPQTRKMIASVGDNDLHLDSLGEGDGDSQPRGGKASAGGFDLLQAGISVVLLGDTTVRNGGDSLGDPEVESGISELGDAQETSDNRLESFTECHLLHPLVRRPCEGKTGSPTARNRCTRIQNWLSSAEKPVRHSACDPSQEILAPSRNYLKGGKGHLSRTASRCSDAICHHLNGNGTESKAKKLMTGGRNTEDIAGIFRNDVDLSSQCGVLSGQQNAVSAGDSSRGVDHSDLQRISGGCKRKIAQMRARQLAAKSLMVKDAHSKTKLKNVASTAPYGLHADVCVGITGNQRTPKRKRLSPSFGCQKASEREYFVSTISGFSHLPCSRHTFRLIVSFTRRHFGIKPSVSRSSRRQTTELWPTTRNTNRPTTDTETVVIGNYESPCKHQPTVCQVDCVSRDQATQLIPNATESFPEVSPTCENDNSPLSESGSFTFSYNTGVGTTGAPEIARSKSFPPITELKTGPIGINRPATGTTNGLLTMSCATDSASMITIGLQRDNSSTSSNTPRDNSSTSLTMPRDNSSTSLTTPRDNSSTSLTTPRDNSRTSLTTSRDNSNRPASLTMPRDNSSTSLTTPRDKSSTTSLTMPRGNNSTSLTTPRDNSSTSLTTPRDNRSSTSSTTPRDNSSTSLTAPCDNSSRPTSLTTPRDNSSTSLTTPCDNSSRPTSLTTPHVSTNTPLLEARETKMTSSSMPSVRTSITTSHASTKPSSSALSPVDSCSSFVLPDISSSMIMPRVGTNTSLASTSRERRRREEMRLTSTIFLVVTIYVISWLPYCLLIMIHVLDEDLKVPRRLDLLTLLMGYANSFYNPVIYGWKNPSIRRGYVKLWKSLGALFSATRAGRKTRSSNVVFEL